MLHQTKVLLDRAVALRRAGQWKSSIDLTEEAFRSSVEERDPMSLVEAVLSFGLVYRQMSDAELAIEYLELAHVLAELHGDLGLSGRALNSLAVVYQQQGAVEVAEGKYQDAQILAEKAGNRRLAGNIAQNLGALTNIRGDLDSALAHYRAALEHYEADGHSHGIAGVLNNLGMLHIDRDELAEAQLCLERALDICRMSEDVVTESIVHTNRTELFLAAGDLAKARLSCDDAFEISSRIGDNPTKSEALKFYGIIYRESNKPHLAEIHLRQSIAIASKYHDVLTEAEAQRELALVFREQNKNRDALAALNRAHSLFSALRADRDQADVNKRIVNLEEDFLSIVRVWGESIEAKDLYTSGHCQRVADYACRIAEEAGVSEREMVWFRMGAFLHDLGKMEVPEEILNKPGRLTDEERALMERHTIIGDEMLAHIPFPWDIRPMVRSHHERWDGNGYPDQLVGEDIPFTARILRIADIFDALTTARSYRQPLGADEAFSIMCDDFSGFDPDLFKIFEHLLPEFKVALSKVACSNEATVAIA